MASTAYFFAPKGGWKSELIVNPYAQRDAGLLKLKAICTAMAVAMEHYHYDSALDCLDCQAVARENQRVTLALARQEAYYDREIAAGRYVSVPVWGREAQLTNALERLM